VTTPADDAESSGANVQRRAWVAALLGFLAPGLGQIYVGQLKWGVALLLLWFLVLALFHTDLPATFTGFVISLASFPLVVIAGMAVAGVAAWRRPMIARQQYHRWYVYALYAVGFNALVGAISEGAFASWGQPSLGGAYRPFTVSSSSMEPGLKPGEYFITKRALGASQGELRSRLGQIVVLTWSEAPDDYFVYRLVAVGGERVAAKGRDVSINDTPLRRRALCSGSPVPDTGIVSAIETRAGRSYVVRHFEDSSPFLDMEETVIPENSFFVLGDSRSNANDSRVKGAVQQAGYRGEALFILWSHDWNRIGRTLSPNASINAQEYCSAVAK
jgi:signal peptidase I